MNLRQCFRTDKNTERYPWWKVDLGTAALVYSVSVTNAGGDNLYLAQYFRDVTIRIGHKYLNGINPICRQNLTIKEPITVSFVCEKEMAGKFVFIEKAKGWLFLCEVEVYGSYI